MRAMRASPAPRSHRRVKEANMNALDTAAGTSGLWLVGALGRWRIAIARISSDLLIAFDQAGNEGDPGATITAWRQGTKTRPNVAAKP